MAQDGSDQTKGKGKGKGKVKGATGLKAYGSRSEPHDIITPNGEPESGMVIVEKGRPPQVEDATAPKTKTKGGGTKLHKSTQKDKKS